MKCHATSNLNSMLKNHLQGSTKHTNLFKAFIGMAGAYWENLAGGMVWGPLVNEIGNINVTWYVHISKIDSEEAWGGIPLLGTRANETNKIKQNQILVCATELEIEMFLHAHTAR